MSSDTCKLSDIAEVQGGFAFKSADFSDTGVAVVKIANIQPPSVSLANVDRIAPDKLKGLERFELLDGDILMAMTGATVGKAGRFRLTEPAYLNQRVARISAKKGHLFDDFVYAVVSLPGFDNLIEGASAGSAQANISAAGIGSVVIPKLSDSEQIQIGGIARMLDDRIALLRETNATLEAIAQALFKSWFVDFDPVHARALGEEPAGLSPEVAALFPASFEDSELGMVPKGWRAGAFGDVCARIESGGTPKRSVPEYWGGGVPWLSSGEVRNPIVFDTKETITDLGVRESAAKLWPQGTTVVAMYGATAGEVCLLAKPTTANQACCGLIPKSQTRAFMFMCARRERVALASKSSGSAQQNLNKGLIESHSLVLPPNEVLNAYEESAGALLDCWIANAQQAQTLATLRDTLLPRLISGQLRLPEAKAMVREVQE
ncbi:restriction endonuclease subunit S [Aeromonas caviae]|uniref:restriction endonuclease subunit S n=1 Tax=Aeromonas caviae TaxID=648 RepID=UPI002B469A9B|nr:restriction endonuclease subunit S [Aeromonas caviae]